MERAFITSLKTLFLNGDDTQVPGLGQGVFF